MKKLIMMICLAGLAIINVQSGNIPLQGSLEGTGKMRGEPQDPVVEAYQNPTDVEMDFNANLGSLDIVITNQLGVIVFQTTVDATDGGKLYIDTSNFPHGLYTLFIVNEDGDYLEGYFTIKKS